MARTKDARETPQQRVEYLMAVTKGTMPMSINVYSEEEAADIDKVLKTKGKKAANLTVKLIRKGEPHYRDPG